MIKLINSLKKSVRPQPFLLQQRTLFSVGGPSKPPGGNKNTLGDGGDGYESDGEEGKKEFESDRKFSNFILFGGALAMVILLMGSNVQQ